MLTINNSLLKKSYKPSIDINMSASSDKIIHNEKEPLVDISVEMIEMIDPSYKDQNYCIRSLKCLAWGFSKIFCCCICSECTFRNKEDPCNIYPKIFLAHEPFENTDDTEDTEVTEITEFTGSV